MSIEDSMKEDYGEGAQASSALIENTMPEPPVPTPGRGRRRTTARGRRTTAKPRGVQSRSAARLILMNRYGRRLHDGFPDRPWNGGLRDRLPAAPFGAKAMGAV
ncbi:hypothetical protein MRX96_015001 [Rhipicephalus microplus]